MALDFAAGCLGGAVGVVVGHPFDTVKVRLQTQERSSKGLKYKGMMDCVRQIAVKESIFGFYKGMASPLVGVSGINAVIFGVQAITLRRLDQSVASHAISGCVSGCVQSFICCPVEFAKTKLQIQGQGERLQPAKRLYSGPLDLLRKTLAKKGIRGCYCGMWSTVARDGPAFAIYFGAYEVLCNSFVKTDSTIHELPPSVLLMCGGLTGTLSWIFTYPIDVVKSRVQAYGFMPNGKYRNYMHCIEDSYATEGARVFTRGMLVTLIRAFPVNAATLATVTLFLRLFHKHDR